MPSYTDNIRVEPVNFERVISRLDLIPNGLKSAIQSTILKTIEFTKEEIPKLIIARYDISKSSLMDQTSRAKFAMMMVAPVTYTKSGGYILNGRVMVRGNRMPVMRFSVDPQYVPNQRGIPVASRQIVTVKVKRGTAQVGRPNVFMAKMKSGHLGVFRRKPDATHRIRPDGQRTQLNITEEYMLSVPEMLAGKDIRAKLDENVAKFMRTTFDKEIEVKGMRLVGRLFRI